jgi:hypothetical protein
MPRDDYLDRARRICDAALGQRFIDGRKLTLRLAVEFEQVARQERARRQDQGVPDDPGCQTESASTVSASLVRSRASG